MGQPRVCVCVCVHVSFYHHCDDQISSQCSENHEITCITVLGSLDFFFFFK